MKNLKSVLLFIFKNWILVVIAIVIIYFIVKPEKKDLIIVKSIGFDKVEVTEDDHRVSNIWGDGEVFVINNSGRTIYLESVEYSTSSFNYYTPTVYDIKNKQTYSAKSSINYIFVNPPSSISIKGRGSRTKWHLHR